MHGKEQVIAPLVERFLGLRVETAARLDTDRFGTFSRDVDRCGTQLDAARAKITAALAMVPECSIGLASEGTFGPHPFIPFVPIGREIVVLADRRLNLEIVGSFATLETNFSHAVANDFAAARTFAERIGFPGHGIIALGCRNDQPAPDIALIKDITTWQDLALAVDRLTRTTGGAFLSRADMRAHRNPRRMRAIKRAALDLLRRYRSACPKCSRPGFAITDRPAGLPCSWCGGPTLILRAEIWSCDGCGWRDERPAAAAAADPANCTSCNP